MTARWTRVLAVGSVLLVALVAAVVSYAHIHDLAARSGEGWRAVLIPLSVDGMLLAATLAIVDRRRACQPAGWVPWTGLALGLVASLAANVAAAEPDPVAQLVAGWPPVALAVSIETLVIILRNTAADRPTAGADGRTGRPAPAEPGGTAAVVGEPGDAEHDDPPDQWADAQPAPPGRPVPTPGGHDRTDEAGGTDHTEPGGPPTDAGRADGPGDQVNPAAARAGEPDDPRADRPGDDAGGEQAGGPDRLLPQVIGWAERTGAVPARDRVKAEFGIGSARAARLRDDAAAHLAARPPGGLDGGRPAGGDGRNGHGEARAG